MIRIKNDTKAVFKFKLFHLWYVSCMIQKL